MIQKGKGHFMKKDIFDFQAEVCRMFANPQRLQILNLLKTHELSVSDIIKALETPKANVSQYLAQMRLRGFLKTRRDGTNIYYRIANAKLVHACGIIQDALGQIMESEQERGREHQMLRKEYSVSDKTQTGCAQTAEGRLQKTEAVLRLRRLH